MGGIANLTVLPGDPQCPVTGFDTGPGNTLMDAWVRRHRGAAFDHEGAWAARGTPLPMLLERLLADTYFKRPPPKSTGRELFNEAWLAAALAAVPEADPGDVQASLCELTALSVAAAVTSWGPAIDELLVCGGGVHNRHLLGRLAAHLPTVRVASTADAGVDPDWMEAMAFAWLAQQFLLARPGNLPSVTGAERPVILGALYPA